MESKIQGKHFAFLGVLGKVLDEFWGNFPVSYAILRYITLFYDIFPVSYAIFRYITLFQAILLSFSLIFDSMISYLSLKGPHFQAAGEGSQ